MTDELPEFRIGKDFADYLNLRMMHFHNKCDISTWRKLLSRHEILPHNSTLNRYRQGTQKPPHRVMLALKKELLISGALFQKLMTAIEGLPFGPVVTGYGWILRCLTVHVSIGATAAKITEERTIKAVRKLTEIKNSWEVPAGQDGAQAKFKTTLADGGSNLRVAMRERNHGQGRFMESAVELPATIYTGRHHTYRLVHTIKPASCMWPSYILTPKVVCDRLEVHVRFSRGVRPAWVREVDGESVRDFDDQIHTGRVSLNGKDGVRATFRNLQPNVGYGLQWS